MGVGGILRVSWVCLLLFGGAVQSMKEYNYPHINANRKLGGYEDERLESSPTEIFSSNGPATGYADRSYRAPIASPPQQPLTPTKGAFRKRRSASMDFRLGNGMEINWDLFMPHEPITFPLYPTYRLAQRFDDLSGGELQITPVDISSELFPPSSYPGNSVFPNYVPSSDPTPPLYQLTNSEVTFTQPFEAVPVSSASENLNFQFDVQDGTHGYSPNKIQYPSAENAQLPFKEVGPSNYDSVNAVQPSTWTSAPFESKELPVFSGNSADGAQAAPVKTAAFPSYATDSAFRSSSSKEAAQPVRFRSVKAVAPQMPSTQQLQRPQAVSMSFPATYIVQSNGGYSRGRNVNTKTRSYKEVPPFGLKGQRRHKW